MFPGFPAEGLEFLRKLAKNNKREWFQPRKEIFEAKVKQPMIELVEAVNAELLKFAPDHINDPKKAVYRIYRDTRFSADKTPYKTHIAAVLRLAGRPIAQAGNAALYVHIGLDEEYVGVGCYYFDAAKLARWRRAVVGAPGTALLPILARLRKAGYTVGSHDDYKRVPRGFAPDHPRADLLKKRGLTCAFPEIPAGLLHEPGWADWVFRHARATAPLVIWLHRYVG
jgi:uncharacterized protein (TIGR02453 family)